MAVSQWRTNASDTTDVVLSDGEIGYCAGDGFRVGDGTTKWSDLHPVNITIPQANIATKQDLAQLREEIMSELDDTLKAITTQLYKARGEIVGKIDQLEAEFQGAGVQQATIDDLKAAAQTLDDVVPDVVPDTPPADTPPTG